MKEFRLAWLLEMGLLSLAVSGCGGGSSSSGGTCTVPTCGGDPTGTWTLTSSCLDTTALRQAFLQGSMGKCPQATVGANITPTGTLALNADLTYVANFTLGGNTTINIPTSCLNGATCADLSAALQLDISADPTIQSASCSGSGTCACTEVLVPQPVNESGTYTKSGSSLTLTATGGTPATDSYCVSGMGGGTMLTLGESMMSTGTMGNFATTLTGRKQ